MSNEVNSSTSTEANCYVQQDVNDSESNLTSRTKVSASPNDGPSGVN